MKLFYQFFLICLTIHICCADISKKIPSYLSDHNCLYDAGLRTYYKAFNKFTNMSLQEIKKYLRPLIEDDDQPPPIKLKRRHNQNIIVKTLPEKLFSLYELESPVHDQGPCASGYAFAAVGAIEGRMMHEYGRYDKLSVQEVMECTNECSGGGDYGMVFELSMKRNGLAGDSDNKYNPRVLKSCSVSERFNRVMHSKVSKWHWASHWYMSTEHSMRSYMAANGPVLVTIDVYNSFLSYGGGIYQHEADERMIGKQDLLVVNYGTEGDKKYWVLKNSMGTGWGEKGYMRMLRGSNECNIENGYATSLDLE